MQGKLSQFCIGKRMLLVAAATTEAKAVFRAARMPVPGNGVDVWQVIELSAGVDLVVSGIGKANAAAAAARCADPSRHGCVISVGIAGVLPGGGLEIGQAVAATTCAYADEGIETPSGFLDCGQMGFPMGAFPGRQVPVDPRLSAILGHEAGGQGVIATVSTCSGTDQLAARVRERTGAIAEAMEGAAVAQAALRLGIPGGELRIISNTTGDRDRQKWDARLGFERLSEVLGRLLG